MQHQKRIWTDSKNAKRMNLSSWVKAELLVYYVILFLVKTGTVGPWASFFYAYR